MTSLLLARAARSLRPALAILLAVALAACGTGGASGDDPSPVPTSTVDLPASYKFEPVAITVPAGTTVTWTNSDNFTHNVRFDAGEPQAMAPGEQVSRTFDTPGTYDYICSLHPNDMQGSVLVTAD